MPTGPFAACPTVVAALGDAGSVAALLQRDLDDGIDLEPERGVRLVAEQGYAEPRGAMQVVAAEAVAATVAAALAELREPEVAAVVPASAGMALAVVCRPAELGRARALVAALWAQREVQRQADALRERGGVAVWLWLVADTASEASQAWAAAPAEADMPRCAGVVVPRQRDVGWLTAADHAAAAAMTLRLALLAGTLPELRRELVPGALRTWWAVELVDVGESLRSERERQRFARWVEGLHGHPGDSERHVAACPTTALLQQAQRGPREHPALRSWDAASDAIARAAEQSAETVAASAAVAGAADDPSWADATATALAAALGSLHGRGRQAGAALAAALRDQPAHDRLWAEGLHEALGWCGTAPLCARLEAEIAALEELRPGAAGASGGGGREDGDAGRGADADALRRERARAEAALSASLGAALAPLQAHGREVIGPPPPGLRHWLAWLFAALAAASTPLWYAAAVALGEPQAATMSGAGLWLRRGVWQIAHQDWTVAIASAAGLAAWAAAAWALRRRHARQVRLWAEQVGQVLRQAATGPDSPARREQAAARASAEDTLRHICDAATHTLRRSQGAVRASEPVIDWLVQRLTARHLLLAQAHGWVLHASVPDVRWLLVPPLPRAQQGGEAAMSAMAPSKPPSSPWRVLAAFDPHGPGDALADDVVAAGPLRADRAATLQARLLRPARLVAYWRAGRDDAAEPMGEAAGPGGGDSRGGDPGGRGDEGRGDALRWPQPPRLQHSGGARVLRLASAAARERLQRRAPKAWPSALIPAGVARAEELVTDAIGGDRVVVLQVATLLQADAAGGAR